MRRLGLQTDPALRVKIREIRLGRSGAYFRTYGVILMADFEDIFFDDLIDALYQKRRERVRDTSDEIRNDSLQCAIHCVCSFFGHSLPARCVIPQREHDAVNHPDYYCSGGIETLDYILAKKMDFLIGQVCKYISRAGYTETSGCDSFRTSHREAQLPPFRHVTHKFIFFDVRRPAAVLIASTFVLSVIAFSLLVFLCDSPGFTCPALLFVPDFLSKGLFSAGFTGHTGVGLPVSAYIPIPYTPCPYCMSGMLTVICGRTPSRSSTVLHTCISIS